MRYLIALIALFAIISPVHASEQQAHIIKGTKSYQTRYITSQNGAVKVEQIEPAAGAEMAATEKMENKMTAQANAIEAKAIKKMVLHGKR